jgi:hypothetical protein
LCRGLRSYAGLTEGKFNGSAAARTQAGRDRAADGAGYNPLMEVDEEQTLATLLAHRRGILEFVGNHAVHVADAEPIRPRDRFEPTEELARLLYDDGNPVSHRLITSCATASALPSIRRTNSIS